MGILDELYSIRSAGTGSRQVERVNGAAMGAAARRAPRVSVGAVAATQTVAARSAASDTGRYATPEVKGVFRLMHAVCRAHEAGTYEGRSIVAGDAGDKVPFRALVAAFGTEWDRLDHGARTVFAHPASPVYRDATLAVALVLALYGSTEDVRAKARATIAYLRPGSAYAEVEGSWSVGVWRPAARLAKASPR